MNTDQLPLFEFGNDLTTVKLRRPTIEIVTEIDEVRLDRDGSGRERRPRGTRPPSSDFRRRRRPALAILALTVLILGSVAAAAVLWRANRRVLPAPVLRGGEPNSGALGRLVVSERERVRERERVQGRVRVQEREREREREQERERGEDQAPLGAAAQELTAIQRLERDGDPCELAEAYREVGNRMAAIAASRRCAAHP